MEQIIEEYGIGGILFVIVVLIIRVIVKDNVGFLLH